MRVFRLSLALSVLVGGAASAQATRTWVSGVGDDANPCSRTAPCKTFAGAISKTAAGGEINALDPAGFGVVTITKAITIDARHTLGGVVVSGTNGIVVNAGVNDVVVLRGLDLHGVSTTLAGVNFLGGKALHIEDSTFMNFSVGVRAEGANAQALFLKDVTITGGVSAGQTVGVSLGQGALQPDGGVDPGATTGPSVVMERTRITSLPIGLLARSGAKVTARNVTIADSSEACVRLAHTATAVLDASTLAHCGVGVDATDMSAARLSDTLVSNSGTAVRGNVASYGNNRLNAGNAAVGTPASTVQQQ